MEVKVGDIYIRHSDEKICRVKWANHISVVLESEDGRKLRLTSVFALEKAYRKRESNLG